jgi:hypothetical protein
MKTSTNLHQKHWDISSVVVSTNSDIAIRLDISIILTNDDQDFINVLHDVKQVKQLLSGLPKWCTPEMAQKALENQYPQYYL